MFRLQFILIQRDNQAVYIDDVRRNEEIYRNCHDKLRQMLIKISIIMKKGFKINILEIDFLLCTY